MLGQPPTMMDLHYVINKGEWGEQNKTFIVRLPTHTINGSIIRPTVECKLEH